jgi:hypothetical protein
MRLDAKVHGTLVKNKDGREIPEDEFIVFRPADNAVPEMLGFYFELLRRQGASREQLSAVQALSQRVEDWRRKHPDRCKVADVEPGELKIY